MSVEAPERIRVAQDSDGFWTCREAVSGSQEYVRADKLEELAAKYEVLLQCYEGCSHLREQAEPAREALRELATVQMNLSIEDWCRISNTILAALEPAEPATDAEREFNEVLNEAEAFNDALPERMRKNARDWLRPDDGPATDVEPTMDAREVIAGYCTDCDTWTRTHNGRCGCGSGRVICPPAGFTIMSKEDVEAVRQWPQFIYDSEGEPSTHPPESRYREALEKIARGLSLTFTSSPTKMSGNEAQAIARAALAQEDGR